MQQLDIIFKKLHQHYKDDDNENIQAILSADIATMNPKNTGKSGFDTYGFQPSNPRYKMKIIHVKNAVNSRFQQVDINKFHEIINFGKKYNFDIQMRDDLALLLFNTYNLHMLGMNGHSQFYVFQFILVTLLTSIQSSKLTCKARIELCKVNYLTLTFFKRFTENWQRCKINDINIANFFDNNNNPFGLWTNKFLDFFFFFFFFFYFLFLLITYKKGYNNNYHRIINNLFCYSYAFKYFSNEISTVNLSSHPLELKFGEIRQGSR